MPSGRARSCGVPGDSSSVSRVMTLALSHCRAFRRVNVTSCTVSYTTVTIRVRRSRRATCIDSGPREITEDLITSSCGGGACFNRSIKAAAVSPGTKTAPRQWWTRPDGISIASPWADLVRIGSMRTPPASTAFRSSAAADPKSSTRNLEPSRASAARRASVAATYSRQPASVSGFTWASAFAGPGNERSRTVAMRSGIGFISLTNASSGEITARETSA